MSLLPKLPKIIGLGKLGKAKPCFRGAECEYLRLPLEVTPFHDLGPHAGGQCPPRGDVDALLDGSNAAVSQHGLDDSRMPAARSEDAGIGSQGAR